MINHTERIHLISQTAYINYRIRNWSHPSLQDIPSHDFLNVEFQTRKKKKSEH